MTAISLKKKKCNMYMQINLTKRKQFFFNKYRYYRAKQDKL